MAENAIREFHLSPEHLQAATVRVPELDAAVFDVHNALRDVAAELAAEAQAAQRVTPVAAEAPVPDNVPTEWVQEAMATTAMKGGVA
jgi:hypothetical protein